MSTANNETHHHHHHHSHGEHHHHKDDTGIFRRRMSDHVKRVRFIRRVVSIATITIAVIVSLAVVYAYVIDRG